jgi:chaperonin GroEL
MHATRAAIENGIVPGGGVAALRGGAVLREWLSKCGSDKDKSECSSGKDKSECGSGKGKSKCGYDEDKKVGVRIVEKALAAPCKQIAQNAGKDGAVVAWQVLEEEDFNFGYDAQRDVFCDLVEAGISDPTKVVLTALMDAASVAGLLITTEAAIVEKPEPKQPLPQGGMGGGMDY